MLKSPAHVGKSISHSVSEIISSLFNAVILPDRIQHPTSYSKQNGIPGMDEIFSRNLFWKHFCGNNQETLAKFMQKFSTTQEVSTSV